LWLVRSMVDWKKTFEVLPALRLRLSFAAMQFYWSISGDGLVDIASAIFHTAGDGGFPSFWKPKNVLELHLENEKAELRIIRWASFSRDGLRLFWHRSSSSSQVCPH
jgi:L-lactate permease